MIRKRIAILLTCHNRKSITISCLTSLYRSVGSEFEFEFDVFLVDDGSTDDTASAVKLQFPKVKILTGDGNLYWGRGMIKAWEEAARYDYDFYLWLNDDAALLDGAITKLLKDSAEFDDNGIIAGVCRSNESEKITYSGFLLKDKKLLNPDGRPLLCDFFNGNVVLIPKSVFQKVGFLDPVFHHCAGDIDYGLRAKKYGFNSYISSDVVATCDSNDGLLKWNDPKYPFKARLQNFRSPVCYNPGQVYTFERRHTSLTMALFRSGIVYIRLVFPGLWIMMGKAKRY